MSYSFAIQASSKEAMKEAVRSKMDEVAKQQPIHERDCDYAVAVADTFIDQLGEDETKDLALGMNGYLGTFTRSNGDVVVSSASVAVSVYYTTPSP